MKSSCGFSLIELMIVLAVTAILMILVLPFLGSGLEAGRAADARAELLASLQLAATRAGITGNHAVLCPSASGQECDDSPDWSRGWLVFLDGNGNREHDPGEFRIKALPALAGKVRLVSTSGRTRIVFQGNGGNAGSNVTLTLCDGRGPSHARALILSNQGKLRDGAPSATGLAACLPAP